MRGMLAKTKTGLMRFFRNRDPGDICCAGHDPAELCSECRAAYDGLVQGGLIRAATTKKPARTIAFRAARGADGRTSAECKADAELVADLRKLGVDRLRTEEPATRARRAARRPAPAPKPWSEALGRSLTGSRRRSLEPLEPPPEPSDAERAEDRADDREDDALIAVITSAYPDYDLDSLLGLPREVLVQWVADIERRRDEADEEIEAAARAARAAAPRGITKALAAKRTREQQAALEAEAEIAAHEFADGGAHPYARALAIRELRAGRKAPSAPSRTSDPTNPPSPYTAALKRRQEDAA